MDREIQAQPTGRFASFSEYSWWRQFIDWGWPATYCGDSLFWADFVIEPFVGPDGNLHPVYVEIKKDDEKAVGPALSRVPWHRVENERAFVVIITGSPRFDTWYVGDKTEGKPPMAIRVDRPKFVTSTVYDHDTNREFQAIRFQRPGEWLNDIFNLAAKYGQAH